MGDNADQRTLPLTPPINYRYGVMPRPGQPGALYFDNTNITEFLRRWDNECEDFGLTDPQKCTRLPDYCTPETKDTIELLSGYKSKNWTTLQSELKDLFWQHDKQKDTTESLNKLIQDSASMDLNVYLLKYDSISDTLVKKGALSTLDRINRFLDGLSEKLRERALEFCTKKDWRLSSHDTGATDPVFKELKDFIATKAEAAQKKTVYDKEYAIRNGNATTATATTTTTIARTTSGNNPSVSSPQAITTVSTSTPTATYSVADLTEQMARLALAMEAHLPRQPSMNAPTGSAVASAPRPFRERPQRCPWCDSVDHQRRECTEFTEALQQKRVRLNERGRVVSAVDGEEYPLMIGKGGMKRFVALTTSVATPVTTPITPIAAGGHNITLESYGNLGPQSSVMITTLDFENNTRTDEIIDVEVNEKRRRDEILRRRVRPRTEDTGPRTPAAPVPPPDVTPAPPPDIDMQDVQDDRRSTTPGASGAPPKKYRLASEVGQHVNASHIGEKIMDTPVQLSIREVLAVSSDVSSYLHDQTRKRRIPINTPVTVPTATATNASVTTATADADADTGYLKQLYACPSGRAKVTIDHAIEVNSLLDHGSELNMMPRRIFEKTNLPIDTNISWRIEKYDSKTNAELDEHGPIGVCHKVSVDIGGVDVIQPIFVVEHCNNELILGRPWKRMVRAEFINENNGSCIVRIKNLDSTKMAEFCSVKAQHERNREFVRQPESSAGSYSLKG
jgi:Protein of unknown function (DUF4100)